MPKLLEAIKLEMDTRCYSRRTYQAYARVMRDLYRYYRRPISQLTTVDFKCYLQHLRQQNKSSQTIALYVNAINFVQTHIYHRTDFPKLRHPKRTRRLPQTLSKAEIKQLIAQTANTKHQLLLALAYGAGLRVSEVVSLQVRDLDFAQQRLLVRQGKGRKDRYTLLPNTLQCILRRRIQTHDPRDFLFESERGGHLTAASARKIFRSCCKKAGIAKDVTFHSLRHSFATHLFESGVQLRIIQELLGHNNIRTTEWYTHIATEHLAKISSPYS